MPDLSYILEKLIEEKNTNVFQISKHAKLDRTTLQRTLKGERLPSLTFIEKLCDYLNVFPSEREEVLKLYKIKKIGKNVYNNRLFIKDMLEQISMISSSVNEQPLSNRNININYIEEQNIKTAIGKAKVNSLITDIIQDEFYNQPIPSLKLYVPFSYSFFFDLLKSTCSSYKDFSIQQIFKLSKQTSTLSDSNHNLKVLTEVLPFAFMKYGNYEPNYYYGTINQSIDNVNPFPYYFLTSKYLIQISANFDKINIESNIDIIDIYKNSFDDTLKFSKKFIIPLNNPVKLASTYMKNISSVNNYFFTIEAQPCFGQFFDKELIDNKIYNEIPQREQIVFAANSLYDIIKKTQKKHYNYFSVEGLEYFIEHGQITDVPEGCSSPFTKKEILELLIQLKSSIISEEFNCRAIDTAKFKAPTNSAFLLYDDNAFVLTNRREDNSIVACLVDESSITQSMLDFTKSFQDEGYLHSKEETILIIDEIIDKNL